MNEKKKRKLTEEEKAEFCKVYEGEWWIEDVHGFYARLKDGKVTVPKEVIKKLKLREDQFLRLHIFEA